MCTGVLRVSVPSKTSPVWGSGMQFFLGALFFETHDRHANTPPSLVAHPIASLCRSSAWCPNHFLHSASLGTKWRREIRSVRSKTCTQFNKNHHPSHSSWLNTIAEKNWHTPTRTCFVPIQPPISLYEWLNWVFIVSTCGLVRVIHEIVTWNHGIITPWWAMPLPTPNSKLTRACLSCWLSCDGCHDFFDPTPFQNHHVLYSPITNIYHRPLHVEWIGAMGISHFWLDVYCRVSRV